MSEHRGRNPLSDMPARWFQSPIEDLKKARVR
jgi:hypothetical protein